MSADSAYRLEDLLALIPEEQLSELAQHLDCRPTLSEIRDVLLGPERDLSTALNALDEESLATLQHLAGGLPPSAGPEDQYPESLQTLITNGLAYIVEIQHEPRIYVPLEVQLALHQRMVQPDPDLRILLLRCDEETLSRLEGIYASPEADEEPVVEPLDRICRLAEWMESRTTLREIFDGLPPAAREILGWTCEHSGPIRAEELVELTKEAGEFYQDRSDVAMGQLLRFGLLMNHEVGETGEVLLVPRSLRSAVLDFFLKQFTEEAQIHYLDLVNSGHLSFPDEGPQGWGGNALRAFRQLIVDWISNQTSHLSREHGVAVGLQLIAREDHVPGPFASLLMDLSSETAFSRQALRYWLAIIDDPWTMDLVHTLGGDPEKLVAYFSQPQGEADAGDVEVWFGHLFQIRAQILLLLSLLQPGKWFAVSALSRLVHLLLASSTIANLDPAELSNQFPFEALPDYGLVIKRPNRAEPIHRWLSSWLSELVAVLGAAELDPSGKYFRVHPDAFCVFRDTDLWFQPVWDDLSQVVGEDLDLWMPIPNDYGPRINGVAQIQAGAHHRIWVEPAVHLADLLRLASWARPVVESSGFGFVFSGESVAAALEQGLDGEEFLLWLKVRLGATQPFEIRSMFPQSYSVVDGSVEGWQRAAYGRVDELIQSLDSWGTSPPGRLPEEIRSWGEASVGPLTDRLHALLVRGTMDDPLIQHLCLLLGEAGAELALPALLAVLKGTPSEVLQHAAAAACMRIGKPCLKELSAMVAGTNLGKERRLIVAMALTGLATLHPSCHDEATEALIKAIEGCGYDSDLQTRLTLELCRSGHPKAESLVETLQGEESWNSSSWEPDDALWLARISPCVWGSLLFSLPLSMLYLVSDEADQLANDSGVRDLLGKAGLNSDAVLYGRPRTPHDDN